MGLEIVIVGFIGVVIGFGLCYLATSRTISEKNYIINELQDNLEALANENEKYINQYQQEIDDYNKKFDEQVKEHEQHKRLLAFAMEKIDKVGK